MSYLFRSILFILVFVGCVQQPTTQTTYKKPKVQTKIIKDHPNMHRATLRPYKVLGKIYRPTIPNIGYKQAGVASWYGMQFHGKYTSNGEVYNMYDSTAAHKTLPMNTIVKVTNLKNQKSTLVRVNDRGPFVNSRIIDLSYKAAKALDIIKHGTSNVTIEVVQLSNNLPKVQNSIQISKPHKSSSSTKIFLQIAAFKNFYSAVKLKNKYSYLDKPVLIKKITTSNNVYYKVIIGYFNSKAEVNQFKLNNPKFKKSIIFKGKI